MKRLMEKIVFSGFVTCCRLAGTPTSRSPPCVKATTDGVVRPPSRFGITVGSPPSSTAMQELVVPRSMPIVFAMLFYLQGEKKALEWQPPPHIRKKSKCPYSRSPQARRGDSCVTPAGLRRGEQKLAVLSPQGAGRRSARSSARWEKPSIRTSLSRDR